MCLECRNNQKRKRQSESWQAIEKLAIQKAGDGWSPPKVTLPSLASMDTAPVDLDTTKINQLSIALPVKPTRQLSMERAHEAP